MKKTYGEPEIVIIDVLATDIITASTDADGDINLANYNSK